MDDSGWRQGGLIVKASRPIISFIKRINPLSCPCCGQPAMTPNGGLCPWCQRALPRWRHGCPRCAEPLPVDGLCSHCLQRPPPTTHCRALWLYAAPTDLLLRNCKYQQRPELAAQLVIAAGTGCRQWPRPDLLAPIPLHRQRLQQRGYNQAQLACEALARAAQLPWQTLLQRHQATLPQAGLTAAQRRRNLRRAFSTCGDVRGLHIALVDDVMTTGSTLFAAARVLLAAGAAQVDGWVLARTPADRRQPEISANW